MRLQLALIHLSFAPIQKYAVFVLLEYHLDLCSYDKLIIFAVFLLLVLIPVTWFCSAASSVVPLFQPSPLYLTVVIVLNNIIID